MAHDSTASGSDGHVEDGAPASSWDGAAPQGKRPSGVPRELVLGERIGVTYTTQTTAVSALRALPLAALRLDPWNPRLPRELQGIEDDLLRQHVALHCDAIDVARSIARHGFFPSEPLIAVPQGREGFVVVEGNRRLVALRLLDDPGLARGLGNAAEWRALAAIARLPRRLPVVVAPRRDVVAPIIGYRHISGIKPWEPFFKARFVAELVDFGSSFAEVAEVVGERVSDVATQYRNFGIVEQAREQFVLDVKRVVDHFGTFTYAMSSLALRAHIGAKRPSQTRPHHRPLPPTAAQRVGELLSWLFGDDERRPVIADSRQITSLGKAVGSAVGLRVLRETRDLDQATAAAQITAGRVRTRLSTVHSHLVYLRDEALTQSFDEQAKLLISECHRLLVELEHA